MAEVTANVVEYRSAGVGGVRPGNWVLHGLAMATLLAAFPLIFMGGLVTTKGAGMSVPDWPNTYGYNMWLFPPSMWIGGIFYEHTHRLLGTLVGLLAVATALCAWAPARRAGVRRGAAVSFVVLVVAALACWGATAAVKPDPAVKMSLGEMLPHLAVGFGSLAIVAGLVWAFRAREERRWVRWLTVAVLGAVILQGIKGGLRVDWVSIELAIAHGIFGQLVMCLMAATCVVTSAWWRSAPDLSLAPVGPGGRKIVTAAWVVFGLVTAQLVVGATMRHLGAGLAIPDLPLAYGKVLPPTDGAGLEAANRFRLALADPALKPTTLGGVWLHFGHRTGAVIVTLGVLHLAFTALRRAGGQAKLYVPAALLLGLIVAQVSLGVATVMYRKPADVTTLHHTVGAVLLMTVGVLAVRAGRLYSRRGVQTAEVRRQDLAAPAERELAPA